MASRKRTVSPVHSTVTRRWVVAVGFICVMMAVAACRKEQGPALTPPSQPVATEQAVPPKPVSASPELSRSEQLEAKLESLERRAESLQHRVDALKEANRKLVQRFQNYEAQRETVGLGPDGSAREAMVAGAIPATGKGVVYLWDKPGGYGTGAQVAGQVQPAEKVMITDETVVRSIRWFKIYTTEGVAFKTGWVPADALKPVTPNRKN